MFKNDGAFGDDFEVSPDSPMSSEDTKNDKDNPLDNGLKSLSSSYTSNLTLTSKEINEEITTKLLNFSSGLVLIEKTNFTNLNDKTLRVLKFFDLSKDKITTRDLSKIKRIKSKNELRNLQVKSFDKPIEFADSIFKINILGITMRLDSVIKVYPRTGYVFTQAILVIGKLQLILFYKVFQTDLGLGLSRTTKMMDEARDYLDNIHKTIKRKIPSWMESILNNVDNVTDTLSSTYDISYTYQAPMENLISHIYSVIADIFNNIGNLLIKETLN